MRLKQLNIKWTWLSLIVHGVGVVLGTVVRVYDISIYIPSLNKNMFAYCSFPQR